VGKAPEASVTKLGLSAPSEATVPVPSAAEPGRDIWGADGASAALTGGSDVAVPLVGACEPSLVEPSQAASGSASSAPRTIALFMHLSTRSRMPAALLCSVPIAGIGADSFILDIAKLNL
jgi:hypothetical protein